MRVHLRLTEKDVDLCRWRRSLKRRMITYYVSQILFCEIRGEIAYLPTSFSVSASGEPCEVYMEFTDPQIVEYLSGFPEFKRNATLKRIIRKHLQLQKSQPKNYMVYQSEPEDLPFVKKAAPQKKVRTAPPVIKKPIQPEPRKEIVESDEDRAAILALIAMGGE